MDGWDVLAAIIWSILVFAALCAVGSIVVYVLHSISLYRGLSACGYVDPWMAWAPVLRQYALADCAVHGMDVVYVGRTPFPGWLFRFYWAICWALMLIPYGGWILSIALHVFAEGPCWAAMYGVVDGRDSKDEMLVGYLSAIVPIIPIVKLWNAGK